MGLKWPESHKPEIELIKTLSYRESNDETE